MKICKILGIKCPCDYKNGFLDFFASVMAEAISESLNLNVRVACAELRLIRYNHKNLIGEVQFFLGKTDIEEAFVDSFNFLERFKFVCMQQFSDIV